MAGNPPFVLESEDGTLEGLSVEVWEEIAEKLEVDFTLRRMRSAGEAIDAVHDGEVDGAIGPLSITSARARRVEFTQPYMQAALGLLTRPASGDVWARIEPFVSKTFFSGVGVLLVVLLLVGTAIWLAERKANEEFALKPVAGIGAGVWLALVTMTTVGYGDKAPQTLAGRILVGVWMLVAMLSVSSLTAGIATALTLSSLDHPTIESADELRDRPVAALAGTTASEFAQEYGANLRRVESLEEAIERLEGEGVDAVVFDRPVLQYHLSQRSDIEVVLSREEYEPQGYGFAFPPDGELRHDVDVALLELEETGRLDAIRSRWL